MKPKLLLYDYREGPGQVLEDLEPILKKKGLYLIPDPSSIGTDTLGYILVDKVKLTVAEYLKLYKNEFGNESTDWLDEICQEYEIKPTDSLTKLVKAIYL